MYFITAICKDRDNENSIRCFGYFNLALDAINAVLQNRGDIQECLYNHVVIEKIGEGIHTDPDSELWFEWDYDELKWLPINKPEWSNNIVNWSIG